MLEPVGISQELVRNPSNGFPIFQFVDVHSCNWGHGAQVGHRINDLIHGSVIQPPDDPSGLGPRWFGPVGPTHLVTQKLAHVMPLLRHRVTDLVPTFEKFQLFIYFTYEPVYLPIWVL